MATEIERKFLVKAEGWRSGRRVTIRQGYLSVDKEQTIRVRTKHDDQQQTTHAYLTVKGETTGISRLEFEYEIKKTTHNKTYKQ